MFYSRWNNTVFYTAILNVKYLSAMESYSNKRALWRPYESDDQVTIPCEDQGMYYIFSLFC
jgi:hypothetical protein